MASASNGDATGGCSNVFTHISRTLTVASGSEGVEVRIRFVQPYYYANK